jgi:alpha-beta hydrolase superfamily lysophospholipase
MRCGTHTPAWYGGLMIERFVLHVDTASICGVVHLPGREKPPCVITCHGLFSSKDTEKFLRIAEEFTGRGIAVIRFDFGGCGESSGSIADTTVTGRLAELAAVVQFARRHGLLGPHLGLLGSSLGGYLSLLYAARDRSIRALSVWATPLSLTGLRDSIPAAELSALKEDFFTDAGRCDLAALLPALRTVLVIHGSQDEIVPHTHAEKIFRRAGSPKELLLIPGGDHSLTAAADRAQAIQKSLHWFERYLKRDP